MSKEKVVIIEEKKTNLEELKCSLEDVYEIQVFNIEGNILGNIEKIKPDAIIIGADLSETDGLKLCKKIRNDMLMGQIIPIIMFSENRNIDYVVRAFDIGVDDYIFKPCDALELKARIKAILKRMRTELLTSPLTFLPGSVLIESEIRKLIKRNDKFAVGYVDLDNFKAFNDRYGFARGDEVIKLLADILVKTIDKYKIKRGFVGHIGGDDFMIITDIERINNICENVLSQFDYFIKKHYDKEDLGKKYISSIDRKGVKHKFPIMTISIGVISNEHREITHYGMVSSVLSEVKSVAKKDRISSFFKDRRKK